MPELPEDWDEMTEPEKRSAYLALALAAEPPALDVDAQYHALDKSLLATFQWSDKEYERHGLTAHALLRHLHAIGWDVTVGDPEKAVEYARLAREEGT